MQQYVYSFQKKISDEEVFFKFKKFPEIISTLTISQYKKMTSEKIQKHAEDALILALQNRISDRVEIPPGDDINLTKADGFIILSVQQAMKLELAKVYVENCKSVSDFSRQLNKKETAVRRMIDLRHASAVTEIEAALEIFGKRLVHSWDIGVIGTNSRLARPRESSKHTLQPA